MKFKSYCAVSRVAQRKRAGPITQRSMDRNHSLLAAMFLGFSSSSTDEESTCSAGNPGSVPGSGRSSGQGIGYPLQYSWASLVAQSVKESACNVGDLGSIPGLGRSSEGGQGNPLQCSCLENPHGQRTWRFAVLAGAGGVSQGVGHD